MTSMKEAEAQRGIFRRMTELDLNTVTPNPELNRLTLDRIQNVKGWSRLSELEKLDRIRLIECGSAEPEPKRDVIPVTELSLLENSLSCLKTVLTLTMSEIVTIQHWETPTLDLVLLRHHRGLRHLFLYCGLATGFRHVASCGIERLHITNVELDSEFLSVLSGWKNTLWELWLENEKPFGPQELPDLPKLTLLKIPTYPETLAAWKAWRIVHPGVKIEFQGPPQPTANHPYAAVAEIHRDVAVMKVTKGKKITYEVWGNFSGKSPIGGNNHDLRHWLEMQAENAKKKITVFSEADEIGISTTKPEIVKWCIDTLLDGKTGTL